MFFQYQKTCLVTEKRQIRCNDPAARTLVTVRKMKPADLSRALQITRLSPGSSIPSVQHQHLWPYSSKQLHTLQWNICEASAPFTATAHGLESSLLKQTPSPPGTSHHCRNSTWCDLELHSSLLPNQPGCLIEMWQAPYRKGVIM